MLIGKIKKSIYACQAKSNRGLVFASIGAFSPPDPEEAGAERRRRRFGRLGDTAPWQDRCTAPSALRKLAGRGVGTWRRDSDQGTIPGRMAIPEHPADGNSKPRAGDWEADPAIGYGHGGAAATPVERFTGFAPFRSVGSKTTSEVTDAVHRLPNPFASQLPTIMSDLIKSIAVPESTKAEREPRNAAPYPKSNESGRRENPRQPDH